jgi:hypothetical protein
MQYRR